MEKDIPRKQQLKKNSRAATLISDIDFKRKIVTRDKK